MKNIHYILMSIPIVGIFVTCRLLLSDKGNALGFSWLLLSAVINGATGAIFLTKYFF